MKGKGNRLRNINTASLLGPELQRSEEFQNALENNAWATLFNAKTTGCLSQSAVNGARKLTEKEKGVVCT